MLGTVFTSNKNGGTCFVRVCLSVCLFVSVSKFTQKRVHGFRWNVVFTDVGTWTNWLTFEPDPDHSPDAGTELLSPISYRLRNFAALHRLRCYAEFYVGKIPRIRIGGAPLERAVVLKWFYPLSRRKTFVGGKCALPSALLVAVAAHRWQFNSILFLSKHCCN